MKLVKFVCSNIIFAIALLSCRITTLVANDEFDAKVFKSASGNFIAYRVHMPEPLMANKKYPLVMFFHGAGERGNNNSSQLVHGVRDILAYTKESNDPAIIIAAQVLNDQQWVNTPWDGDSHSMPEQPSRSMKLAMQLMKETIDNKPVDKTRVYVTGVSMGGYGTWDILQRLPNQIAAAIPICGGGDPNLAKTIKDVPIWAFHGDMDLVVKPKRSRDMISAIKNVGGSPKYTEYKGVEHDSWTQTYADKNVLKWLFSQRKKAQQ